MIALFYLSRISPTTPVLRLVLILLCIAAVAAASVPGVSFAQDDDDDNIAPVAPSDLNGHKWAVVDSHSLVVGELVGVSGTGDSAVVGLKFFGIEFVVEIDSGRFFGNTGGVFYESDDCVGRILIIAKETLAPLVAVSPPGNTVYVAADSEDPPLDVSVGSTLNEQGECEKLSVSGLELRIARNIVNLDRAFTPPFSLQLVPTEEQ